MKFLKIFVPLLIYALTNIFSQSAVAKERPIFIGDIINLVIAGDNIDKSTIEEKFKDFEMMSLKEIDNAYFLKMRTFTPKKYNILIGNKNISILVKSTLDEFKRNQVFDAPTDLLPIKSSFGSENILYLLILSTLVLIYLNFQYGKFKFNFKRKSDFDIFLKSMSDIDLNDEKYFVRLTYYFKVYIEEKFSRQIRGKTSKEILGELSTISLLGPNIDEIGNWLINCDKFKFSNKPFDNIQKNDAKIALIEIVNKINNQSIGEKK